MTPAQAPYRVSLLAITEAMPFTPHGLYDVLSSFGPLSTHDYALPREPPFQVEIVALARGPAPTASGLPVQAHAAIGEVERTDLVIIPSVMVRGGEWVKGRYPAVVQWLRRMHEQGATLCSACSGLLLLAETGLLSGREATMHWAYEQTFRRNFPDVRLRLEKMLVTAGERQELVMSGAAMAWHDLVLYLIDRYVGTAAAQSIARFFAMRWHDDGQSPYIGFAAPTGHGDAAVADAQTWLDRNFSAPNPVEEMVKRSGVPERSFKRRFTHATGVSPIDYVQRVRIEYAKRRLEQSDTNIDEISWAVGYEDPAFFRRLFRRVTGVAPGAYRRRYRVPGALPRAAVAAQARRASAETGKGVA
jgi:transcriptional regulator GlxA family with amidase domain